jgi:molecular chaperone IbpA
MPSGSTQSNLALKGEVQMTNLARYHTADLPALLDRITRNSIGLDDYFERIFEQTTSSNYPPYNLIQLNNHESILEIALAGFKKEEVNVFTEYGKLFIKGQKVEGEDRTFVHKGLAQRSFERVWTISDDTEIQEVTFEDGLLVVKLGKVIPEHHQRKDYL